jgi:uncharacterized membrane protein YdjX (TVP38/TMEM64 family)
VNAFLLVFVVVLALNVIPAFAPPTWMIFSFLGFRFPQYAGWPLAVTGALAATLGRCILARMSRGILRQHWLGEAARQNVDTVRDELSKRPRLTFSVLLSYALSPLPSNVIFIAYGLTTMKILRVAIPFFIGRSVSYVFWFSSAAAVAGRLSLDGGEALEYFSTYFVITQTAFLVVVYLFPRIDWKALIRERKWKWIKTDRVPTSR